MKRSRASDSKASLKMAQLLLDRHEKELNEFESWIKTKPNLPQSLDKLLLLRFLKVYEFDVEKAKDLLLINLEMRRKNPTIFENRDVLDADFQQAFKTMQICPMPRTTAENNKISVFRLAEHDPNKYVYVDVCRLVVTMMDVRFVTVDDNELINGEIGVIDMSGFTFKHFMKSASNLSVMRNYMKYVQEAAPFKIIQNHFINCSPMVDKFISFVKPFMKKEIIDTMKFHTDLETLYDTLPRELLPNEFGGSAGNIEDIHREWVKVVESKREYILNDENWKFNENE